MEFRKAVLRGNFIALWKLWTNNSSCKSRSKTKWIKHLTQEKEKEQERIKIKIKNQESKKNPIKPSNHLFFKNAILCKIK